MTSTEDGKIRTGQTWTPRHKDEGGDNIRIEEVGVSALGGEELILYNILPLGKGHPLYGLPRGVFELRYELLEEPKWRR